MLSFKTRIKALPRFVIVDVKTSFQELSVSAHSISNALEDASDRNDTLIIALAPVRLRDVWNLGVESQSRPSKPKNIRMAAGGVRWIRPGVHQFSNLHRTPAKFVFIEW